MYPTNIFKPLKNPNPFKCNAFLMHHAWEETVCQDLHLPHTTDVLSVTCKKPTPSTKKYQMPDQISP